MLDLTFYIGSTPTFYTRFVSHQCLRTTLGLLNETKSFNFFDPFTLQVYRSKRSFTIRSFSWTNRQHQLPLLRLENFFNPFLTFTLQVWRNSPFLLSLVRIVNATCCSYDSSTFLVPTLDTLTFTDRAFLFTIRQIQLQFAYIHSDRSHYIPRN